MHVLIIAQYFPPDMGGASTRVSNAVKGLLSNGCDVTVVAAFPHYPQGRTCVCKPLAIQESNGVRVLRVWIPALPHNNNINRILLHLSFIIFSLFALPFVGKVDVVWATNPNLFSFFPAVIYGFVKRKPIVRNVDDLWPEVFYELGLVRSRLMRIVLDFLAWLSYVVPAAVTPLSSGYKQRIVEKYGVCAEKIHVVEVGVDKVEVLNADANASERFVVMYSGVLGVGYDFDVVLEAASLLAKHKDIVFVVRGVGELAPTLRRQIKESKLANVVLDTNFQPKEKLPALLSSADVFMLPMSPLSFVDEGLPTKVFEYQAYGKPIICCSEGEPARYIRLTKSGLVVKPSDPEAFAHAVLKLYNDRKLACALGLNGWRHVSENLTFERVGERICDIFLSIVR